MKYQCPHCDKDLTEDIIMSGTCSYCKKVIDFKTVKKVEDKPGMQEKDVEKSEPVATIKESVDAKRGSSEVIVKDAAIEGKILETREKSSLQKNTALGFSGCSSIFGILGFLFGFVLLFFFPIGTILGIFMMMGAGAFLGGGMLGLGRSIPGEYYKIQCPVCKSTIDNLFKPEGTKQLSGDCPHCAKRYIIKEGKVLHFK
jgi:hypothetical protein